MSATEPHTAVSRRRALHLVALGAVIGVPAALLAALFLATVHELQLWLWHDLPERLDASGPPWYLVLGLPAAGACVVLLARTLLPGDGGHGPLGGISVSRRRFRMRRASRSQRSARSRSARFWVLKLR